MNPRLARKSREAEKRKAGALFREQKRDFSQPRNSPSDYVLHLQRTIGNHAVEGLLKPENASGRGLLAHPSTHVVRQGHGQILRRAMTSSGKKGPVGPKGERCSGWLRDPESTSIVAAKHYVRTELKSSHGNPETVKCELVMPDRFLCRVTFSDGTVITVIARPDVIIVGVGRILTLSPPPDRPLCFYNYSCPSPTRELVLTKRECKSQKSKSK
jgi:hypothetical protein